MNAVKVVENLLDDASAELPAVSTVLQLRPALAAAAQRVYDAWDQDAEGVDVELGTGGICQNIAEEQADVLSMAGIEAITVDAQVGDQHTWVLIKVREGVYEVDIPPSVYEIGGGYTWKKRPGVTFSPEHVLVGEVSNNPNDFAAYSEE